MSVSVAASTSSPVPQQEPARALFPEHLPLRFYRPRVGEVRKSSIAPASLPIGMTMTRFCLCGNCANGLRPDGGNDPFAAFRPTVHLDA